MSFRTFYTKGKMSFHLVSLNEKTTKLMKNVLTKAAVS